MSVITDELVEFKPRSFRPFQEEIFEPTVPETGGELGACCFGEFCEEDTEGDCIGFGGDFKGVGTTCADPDICPIGACCFGDFCEYDSQFDCENFGGVYQGDGTICDPNPCAIGACCTGDLGFPCEEVSEADCAAGGGTFKGGGTRCDDDPNPCPPTGSCCYTQYESCSDNMTESDCSDSEGVYQGDGTNCTDNPCCFCPEITLECDSISASLSKCGFSQFTTPSPINHVYLTQTVYVNGVASHTSGFGCSEADGGGFCTWPHGMSYSTTKTFTSYEVQSDGTCTGGTFAGCTDSSGHAYIGGATGYPCCDHVLDPDNCLGSGTDFDPCSQLPIVHWGTGGGCSVYQNALTGCCIGGAGSSHSETQTTSDQFVTCTCSNVYDYEENVTVLTDEYTTSMLRTNTENALPSYFGHTGCDENEIIGFRSAGQNCVCFASRSLSTDESSYSITRFRYRFTFPPAPCNFTISWNEQTTFAAGGTGNSPRFENILEGQTASSLYSVNEPSADGTVHITDVVCTPETP